MDGSSKFSRLNETVVDLVSGGFVGWRFKSELSKRFEVFLHLFLTEEFFGVVWYNITLMTSDLFTR